MTSFNGSQSQLDSLMKNAHSCNADEGEELINQLNDLDPSFISIEV